MNPRLAICALCFIACTSGGTATPTPSPPPLPAVAATTPSLLPYYGSYRGSDGRIVVIARLGWFFDMRDSSYRTIYAGSAANRFTIGERFAVPLPKFADLTFGPDTLTLATAHGGYVAARVKYAQTDVTIPATGAQLAGTLTQPLSAGPHPGVVIVHGSEPGQRYFYDIWVGLYTSLGVAVLTYDKRGQGSSTGTYPGEFPTDESLAIYADDASAALNLLATQSGIDGKRVGFHGGSQGGWTVPLAIMRHHQATFAVLVSAPATTVGQTTLWKDFSNGGQTAPTQTAGEMEAAVRANHAGYDPAPALRAMNVPALWLLGIFDRTVPTNLCSEILARLQKPYFTVQMIPTGHGLLITTTGMLADDDKSTGLAPAVLSSITTFLHQTVG